MRVLRLGLLLATVSVARAQVPGMYPWWDAPMRNDIGLSEEQNRQISATLSEMRPKMMQLRGAVMTAETELRQEMDATQIDLRRVNDAIEKVVTTRAELTRAVAQMSLKMRIILSADQWMELQKRQARPGARHPGPRGPGMGGPVPHNTVPHEMAPND